MNPSGSIMSICCPDCGRWELTGDAWYHWTKRSSQKNIRKFSTINKLRIILDHYPSPGQLQHDRELRSEWERSRKSNLEKAIK